MNLAIFDLCNVILFVIVVVAAYSMAWHLRFYSSKRKAEGESKSNRKVRVQNFINTLRV
jgi:flagellar basal body-associated protein FliL